MWAIWWAWLISHIMYIVVVCIHNKVVTILTHQRKSSFRFLGIWVALLLHCGNTAAELLDANPSPLRSAKRNICSYETKQVIILVNSFNSLISNNLLHMYYSTPLFTYWFHWVFQSTCPTVGLGLVLYPWEREWTGFRSPLDWTQRIHSCLYKENTHTKNTKLKHASEPYCTVHVIFLAHRKY